MSREREPLDRPRSSSEAEAKILVFVYGSLMRGYGNHRLLEAGGARYLGRATTAPRYALVDLMAFPGLLEGGAARVRGELYEVDAPTLAKLDRLEGHPRFYCRKPIVLARRRRDRGRLGPDAPFWAYFLPSEEYGQRPEIPSGDWRTWKPPARTDSDDAY